MSGVPGLRHRCGFTLVEIILVVTIMMILVSLAATHWSGVLKDASIRLTRIEMASVRGALTNYEAHVGVFPTTAQGLRALVERPAGVDEKEWVQCMNQMPGDYWKHEFKYVCPGGKGREYDLISAGRDGEFGTADDIRDETPPPTKAKGA